MDQPLPTADEIRRQMHITRQRVRAEVGEVVEGARELANWRFYPRQFPWLTLGAAAIAGFAVIPHRTAKSVPDAKAFEKLVPDAKAFEKLVKEHKIVIDPGGKKAKKAGVMGAVLATAGSALLRFGVAYASRELGRRWSRSRMETVGEHST